MFLCEFIASLRTLGKYDGDIAVVSYGTVDAEFGEIFDKDSVTFYPRTTDVNIETDKFLSAVPILEKYDLAVLYDADIWFQNDVTGIFRLIEDNENRILVASERDPYFYQFQKNFINTLVQDPDAILPHLDHIAQTYGAQINAGFVAGGSSYLIELFKQYEYTLATGKIASQYGADQLFLNYAFRFESLLPLMGDRCDMDVYNTIASNAVLETSYDSAVPILKTRTLDGSIQPVIALHLANTLTFKPLDPKRVLFRYVHKHLFRWWMEQRMVVFADESPFVIRPDLSLGDNSDKEYQIHQLITNE